MTHSTVSLADEAEHDATSRSRSPEAVERAMPVEGGRVSPAASDSERYAELEAASTDVAKFEGGGAGIYIGTGTAIVAAAVILLILLL